MDRRSILKGMAALPAAAFVPVDVASGFPASNSVISECLELATAPSASDWECYMVRWVKDEGTTWTKISPRDFYAAPDAKQESP